MDAGVEQTAQEWVDLIPEPYRVLEPRMQLIGFRIVPCFDDREMVDKDLSPAKRHRKPSRILFGRRGLGAKQSPRVFFGLRRIHRA